MTNYKEYEKTVYGLEAIKDGDQYRISKKNMRLLKEWLVNLARRGKWETSGGTYVSHQKCENYLFIVGEQRFVEEMIETILENNCRITDDRNGSRSKVLTFKNHRRNLYLKVIVKEKKLIVDMHVDD